VKLTKPKQLTEVFQEVIERNKRAQLLKVSANNEVANEPTHVSVRKDIDPLSDCHDILRCE
jgi:hypothetical protein